MKKFLISSAITIFSPVAVFAQEVRTIPEDGVAYASSFAGGFSLLLSLVIGIIGTFLVFRASSKLGTGLFGSVLRYVAIGMLFIVLGTATAIFYSWSVDFWSNITSTALFSLGYIFMVIGANKLLKGIINI